LTATANQVITVTAVNDAPVAVDDLITSPEDTPLTLTPLTGDSDPDGTTPMIVSINGTTLTPGTAQTIAVTNGTVTISTTGVITFTPNANYNGSVTFPYVITDGTLTATANQVITVTAVNDAPVAVTDNYTTNEDTAVPLLPLTGDSDPDGTTPTIQSINGTTLTPGTAQTIAVTNGTVNITAAGIITFTPNANYNGSVTFPYVITDGTVTATANQVITVTAVNDIPVAVNDINTIPEDGTLTVPATSGLLSNDTDVDGNPLTITGYTIAGITGTQTPGSAVIIPNVGTITINTNGGYTFVPVSNYNGPVPVMTYTVSDGNGGTTTATLTLTVTPVNDIPVAVNDINTVPEDGTLTVPATSGLLSNDSDIDGNPLTITGYTIAGITGTQTPGSSVIIPNVGTITINANGGYTFVPAANYNGTVPIMTYTVSDGNGGTTTATLTLTVTPVNDPPVATAQPLTTPENTPKNGTVTAIDIDGDLLTFTKATNPANGTVTVNPNGTYTYVPNPNFNGNDSFTVTVSDGNGGTNTVTVLVTVTANPIIGIAKQVSTPKLLLNGYYEFSYTFKVANMGSSLLNNVQVTDDLNFAFSGVENLTITKLEATNGLIINPSFNGSSNKNLLTANNTMAIKTEALIMLTIRVLPGKKFGSFENSAIASAVSAIGNIPTSDTSSDGDNIDLNGNGKPNDNGEDKPTVVTLAPTEVIIPEGFSPNGDGSNDQFIIENTGNKRIEIEIFNRWGNIVYKNPNYKNDWDGRSNTGVKIGSDLPDGTYYYIIVVEGQKLPIKFITINR
jgi:gliding motility-associated-like protein